MKLVDEFLANNDQTRLFDQKIEASMARLETQVELTERLEEEHAIDTNKPKLVEDIVCSFCLLFPSDPVMCDHCEKVFCLKEQTIFYSNPKNEACSHCRQVPTDKIKPLNRKLRRKMTKLKFEC